MTKDMVRWLTQYEHLRTSPYEKNEYWSSSKYDIEGLHWTELREIYIPELDMNWGAACSALKKSWYRYKRERKEGLNASDIALRINKIQRSLGIKQSEFPDLDPNWVDEELTLEEKEAKMDEVDELEWWNDINEPPDEEEDNDDDFGEWENL